MATFTSYVEWYSLPENDPYHGDYSTLFPAIAVHNWAGNAAPLLTSIAVGADSKAAIAFVGTDGKIHILRGREDGPFRGCLQRRAARNRRTGHARASLDP